MQCKEIQSETEHTRHTTVTTVLVLTADSYEQQSSLLLLTSFYSFLRGGAVVVDSARRRGGNRRKSESQVGIHPSKCFRRRLATSSCSACRTFAVYSSRAVRSAVMAEMRHVNCRRSSGRLSDFLGRHGSLSEVPPNGPCLLYTSPSPRDDT